MTTAFHVVRLDARRRPTIPTRLLDAIGASAGDELVASLDDRGRLVLETRGNVRDRLRAVVRGSQAGMPVDGAAE